MEVKVGDCLRAQTKTLEDVFGVCYYEVLETGLPAPEPERKGQQDGLKVRMLGGSGPSAREGLTIIDSQAKIASEINAGIVEVMDRKKAEMLLRSTPKSDPVTGQTNRPPTGVVEMD